MPSPRSASWLIEVAVSSIMVILGDGGMTVEKSSDRHICAIRNLREWRWLLILAEVGCEQEFVVRRPSRAGGLLRLPGMRR